MSTFILNKDNKLSKVYNYKSDYVTTAAIKSRKLKLIKTYGNNVKICKSQTTDELSSDITFKISLHTEINKILFSVFAVENEKYIKLFSGINNLQDIKTKLDAKMKFRKLRKYYKRLKQKKIKYNKKEAAINKKRKNTKQLMISDYIFGSCNSILINFCKFIPKEKLTVHFELNDYNQKVVDRLKKEGYNIIIVSKFNTKKLTRVVKYRTGVKCLKSDIIIFCDGLHHFVYNSYLDDWKIKKDRPVLFQRFKRNIRSFTFARRERRYYFKFNNKSQIVAKNRKKRKGQKELSFNELQKLIKKHITIVNNKFKYKEIDSITRYKSLKSFQVICKPGLKSRRKFNKDVLFHPGDIIKYYGHLYICQYWDSGNYKVKLLGLFNKVKAKLCTIIRKNTGLICTSNFL